MPDMLTADGRIVTLRPVRVPTTLNDITIAAQDARERIAEEHSLRPLLAPRSVAVAGASRYPGGIGHEVLRNITTHGFTGRIYAVNPHATEIAGCLSAPSVSALPETVDLEGFSERKGK